MNDIDAHIKIPLPFCLHLQDGTYPIIHEGYTYQCHLRKEWAPFARGTSEQTNTSHSTRAVFMFNAMTGEPTTAQNVELLYDKRGTFRYSIFEATLKLPDEQNAGKGIASIPNEVLIDKALCLINKLVEAYRLVTDAFYITKIGYYDLVQFRGQQITPNVKISISHGEQGTEMMLGFNSFNKLPIVLGLPDRSPDEHEQIRELLLQDFATPIERTLILNAEDYTHSDKYEVAVFNLGTALEVSIDKYLSTIKSDKEIRELNFEEKYDIALNTKSLKKKDNNLWQMLKKVRNIRNNIAHRGRCVWTDTKGRILEQIDSEEKVRPLIAGTERIIEYINNLSEEGDG